MARLSISKAWDESRDIIARDGRLMFLVVAALVIVPTALLALVDPLAMETVVPEDYDQSIGSSLLSFLTTLSALVAQIAIVVMALRSAMPVGQAIREALSHLPAVVIAILVLIAIGLLIMVPVLVAALGVDAVSDLSALDANTPIEADQIAPAAVLAFLLLFALLIFAAVRLSVMVPVRTAERVGALDMIKRSWHLTRGQFWRIFGFMILLGIGVFVVMAAYGVVVGLVGELLFGEVEAMSVGALYYGLTAGLAQAALTLLTSTIFARIYAQLAGPAEPVAAPVEPSVPPTA